MKKVLVLLSVLLMFSFGFAALSWCGDSYIVVSGVWYDGSATYQDTTFHGHDLGGISSLSLGGELQTYEQTMGVTAEMGYKIRQGSTYYYDTNLNLPWERQQDNNDLWQHDSETTIDISGLDPGTYELIIYFHAYINDTNVYDNNGGNDYIATFTIPTDGEVPVTLASFTAEAKKGTVVLNWVTESEAENSHFLVYRDGEVLAQVEGHGTTSETHSYSYLDTRVQAGIHSYAIADVTYGGVEELHEAVEVEVKAEAEVADGFTLGKAYPNPFNPSVTMRYCIEDPLEVDLGVYNMQGEKVANLYSGMHDSGDHSMMWNATGMPSGIYFIRMIAGDMVQTMKVVLMK